jgi:glycosyltransferase involved in cell wall biosynthesis
MKISVIIPAYNEEKYLSKTLEAILTQDYTDFEVIVVDNASTDRTSDIAKSFQKVKVLFEGNKGTMWACERGRKEATGEIIVRMDADCLPGKDWLSKGSAFFKDDKTVGVSGPYDYYDAKKFFRYFSVHFQKILYSLANAIIQSFKRGAVMIGGNSFMRASTLAAMGGFDTSFTFWGDDTDTAKRLAKFGRIIFDSDLVIKGSARRMKKEGSFNLTMRYIFHFFKVIFRSNKKSSRN